MSKDNNFNDKKKKLRSFIPENIATLLEEYKINNDINILLFILKQFNLVLDKDFDLNELYLSTYNNVIKIANFKIIFEENYVSILHYFDIYYFQKKYSYDNFKMPLEKSIFINNSLDATIEFSERRLHSKAYNNNETIKRTINKSFFTKEENPIFFKKVIEFYAHGCNTCKTINEMLSEEKCIIESHVNTSKLTTYSNYKQDSKLKIETNLINFLKKDFEEKSKIIISIETNTTHTRVVITKKREMITINFTETIVDKKRENERSLLCLNDNVYFDFSDLDSIIDFFKNKTKENPIIIEELTQVRNIIVNSEVYKNIKCDELDIYFAEHKNDSFEKIALDLYLNVNSLDAAVNKIIAKELKIEETNVEEPEKELEIEERKLRKKCNKIKQ